MIYIYIHKGYLQKNEYIHNIHFYKLILIIKIEILLISLV